MTLGKDRKRTRSAAGTREHAGGGKRVRWSGAIPPAWSYLTLRALLGAERPKPDQRDLVVVAHGVDDHIESGAKDELPTGVVNHGRHSGESYSWVAHAKRVRMVHSLSLAPIHFSLPHVHVSHMYPARAAWRWWPWPWLRRLSLTAAVFFETPALRAMASTSAAFETDGTDGFSAISTADVRSACCRRTRGEVDNGWMAAAPRARTVGLPWNVDHASAGAPIASSSSNRSNVRLSEDDDDEASIVSKR